MRRHAAACLRDIVRHNVSLATAVANEPGVLDALASYAASTGSSAPALPALLAFGFLASQSAELADSVAAAPGALPAVVAGLQSSDEHCQAAAAWVMGRIGSWTPALAEAAATALPRLCTLASSAPADSDLQSKCLKAAAGVVGQLADMAVLGAVLMQPSLDPQLLELLLARCSAVMAKQPGTRASFATSGALAWLQARAEANSAASGAIEACLRLFPEELLNHYSQSHASKLLAALRTDPPPVDAIPAVAASWAAAPQQEAASAPAELVPAAAAEVESPAEGAEPAGEQAAAPSEEKESRPEQRCDSPAAMEEAQLKPAAPIAELKKKDYAVLQRWQMQLKCTRRTTRWWR